jgi:GNAT superfamily N-acetyltransferase
MDMLTLVPATALSAKRLSQLLSQAYADYFIPVKLDPYQFTLMCDDMDVDLARSVVAMEGDIPVGLALCSRRGPEGWVSGVGVHPIWRRRGIARRMVQWIQQAAFQDGLRRLRLEALEQNHAAAKLYEDLGFVGVRELLVLTLESGWVMPAAASLPIDAEPPRRLLDAHAQFHDVDPSWQRDLPSLRHRAGRLLGLALREAQELIGYVIYQPQQNACAVLDLAADPTHPQRLKLAEQLLLALHGAHREVGGHSVNVPAQDPLLPAFMQVGYRVWQRQREMVWLVDEVT